MIFGNLFKSNKEDENVKNATTSKVGNTEVESTKTNATTSDGNVEGNVDDTQTKVPNERKKTKETKTNKALTQKNKKLRSKRISHVKKSFHPSDSGTVKERVNLYDVIRKPRITEKAAVSSQSNVYIFEVAPSANKHIIADAVELIYNVRPVKIRIAKTAAKPKRFRGARRYNQKGSTSPIKKAYVHLKAGDKIKIS